MERLIIPILFISPSPHRTISFLAEGWFAEISMLAFFLTLYCLLSFFFVSFNIVGFEWLMKRVFPGKKLFIKTSTILLTGLYALLFIIVFIRLFIFPVKTTEDILNLLIACAITLIIGIFFYWKLLVRNGF